MDVTSVISAIVKLRTEMIRSNAINNPVVMSELMVKLAQLAHMLGDHTADAQLAARQTKVDVFKALRTAGSSVSAAESEARLDPKVVELESMANRLTTAVSSTNNLISACQSHIKVKLAEASRVGV